MGPTDPPVCACNCIPECRRLTLLSQSNLSLKWKNWYVTTWNFFQFDSMFQGCFLSSYAFWLYVFFVQFVDNVPILQIDMVWCYFLLQDISWLSVAGIHLEKAREGLERCHGKDLSRVRLLQAGRQPELALWVLCRIACTVVLFFSFNFIFFRLKNSKGLKDCWKCRPLNISSQQSR